MFHVDLLTPYRETEFHGANYTRPPPDLIGEEEQYEVEQVLDERNYGRWKKKQYLVKWKGYPDSDNQWLDAKDMENAQELIAEFHNSHHELCSHIKRALRRYPALYPFLSALPSTSTSEHMSDAAHSSDHTTAIENTDPLPIPPRMTTPDAPTGSIRAVVPTTFYRVRDEDFPHPDEPTPSELNDSDQENVPPPVIPSTTHTSSPIQAQVLRRTQMSVPFSNDDAVNQALVSALTRVRNNVDRGNMYQLEIEEIVRIGRALQYRGTLNNDEEAALLVAQLDNIRRLESGTETDSTPSPPPTNVAFPTPTIPRNSQVTASTAASHARVRAVARGSAPPQPAHTRGSQGSGSQARHLGARVPPIPEGVQVGAELLLTCLSRGAETPPPLGFNFNRGANYVPCIVTDNRGRGVPARYTRVIMGPDPHVIGIIPGDNSQYGGPLYAIPDHNQGERPRYAHDDFWRFKLGADDFDRFKSALEHIRDLSLTAEVTRYRETSRLFFQYQEEIRKIEERLWQAGQMKDTSGRRLEGANVLHRIEEALVDLDHRSRVRHGNMRR